MGEKMENKSGRGQRDGEKEGHYVLKDPSTFPE